MDQHINLTPFQKKTLESLMSVRLNAQKEEREFTELIFRANGRVAPPDGIDYQKDGKLIWKEEPKTDRE